MRGFVRRSRVVAVFLIAVTVGLGWASLPARADEEGWTTQFGSPLNDAAVGLSAHGNALYAYGRVGGVLPGETSAGGQDLYLRKFDTRGNVLWTRQFGTPGLDESLSGNVEAGRDRVIVAGGVTGALPGQTWAGDLDAFIRAYDADGNVLWTHQFGTPNHDMVRNVAVDRHGSIYVAAQTNGALPGQTWAGDRDAVVMKFDPAGNPVWTHQFGSPGFEEAIGVTIRGRNVYATGVTRSVLPGQVSAGETDGFVIKLDANDGEPLWVRQFGSAGSDSPWKVRVIGRGVFASGHTTGNLGGTNAGVLDPFLVRMDPDGDIEWIRQFGSPAQDFAVAMTVHAGGIAIAGSARGPMPGQVHYGDADFYVREYGPDGEERWTLQWGTADLNNIAAVAAKGDVLYVAGNTVGALPGQTSAGGQDAVVIRMPDMADNQDQADEEDEGDDEDDESDDEHEDESSSSDDDEDEDDESEDD